MRLLSSHLVKRFTRLSGLALSGMCVATLGSWVRLLPTIPLMSAASVVTCLATMPVGWLGYPCVKASRMARYRRRVSLIVCSFWIGRTFHRAYTMRQPLNYLLQNDLAKVSGREFAKEHVRAMTLDAFFQSNVLERVRLLKVDCEGTEYLVIAGGRKVLK